MSTSAKLLTAGLVLWTGSFLGAVMPEVQEQVWVAMSVLGLCLVAAAALAYGRNEPQGGETMQNSDVGEVEVPFYADERREDFENEQARVESLFAEAVEGSVPGSLAIMDAKTGSVRLTATGRTQYAEACRLCGLEPEAVKTADQLTLVRRMDAEMMLQRLMDQELQAQGA